ncbi:MAG: transcription termination factor NusA [Planctomycetia bacterium]|nr:transcription termination factor NusA [Planctomycetia bacterium]
MNPDEVLRIVEQIHLERKIDKEIVFVGIEQALVVAARKQGMDDSNVIVHIDRQTGEITAYRDNVPLTPSEIAERIGAQTAKQVMIQKIREAERDAVYDEYFGRIGQMESGVVYRNEGGATTVTLQNVEAVLPNAEKIPIGQKGEGRTLRENFRPGDRIHAVIVDVKKAGTKVKVILSRSRPIFVQRLFEQEVPEIAEGIIVIKGISREAGNRTKVAVYCSDPRIDSVGACIGMRKSRIRNILDELGNERIDVVAWESDLLAFIPKALQPAAVDEVILCSMLGRAIVLVQKDQRSLAIGRKGQNVRLASRLCDWDIDIMTREELDQILSNAVEDFLKIDGMSADLADCLVGEGYFSYDDLSVIEPPALMEMGNLTKDEADHITEQADFFADQLEKEALEPKENDEINEENEKENDLMENEA